MFKLLLIGVNFDEPVEPTGVNMVDTEKNHKMRILLLYQLFWAPGLRFIFCLFVCFFVFVVLFSSIFKFKNLKCRKKCFLRTFQFRNPMIVHII